MHADHIRWLFAYDRWATRRVLDALDGLDPDTWQRPEAVGDRGLAGILSHHLAASIRWRAGLASQGEEEGPPDPVDPLPTIAELRASWDEEWATVDAWLTTLTDDFVAYVFDGVDVWKMLTHVVNHGTQHRSEAAALLTAEERSPGELDMINFAEDQAAAKGAEG